MQAIPTGRLNGIIRDWDFEAGWTRVPLTPIAFNSQLTPLTRLVWIWLSSVPTDGRNSSWGECEAMLNCSTKSRRTCIAQLAEKGYVSVSADCVVTIHNPYHVYKQNEDNLLEQLKTENKYFRKMIRPASVQIKPVDIRIEPEKPLEVEVEEIIDVQVKEEHLPVEIEPIQETAPVATPINSNSSESIRIGAYSADSFKLIIDTWNECKPKNYAAIKTLSSNQRSCIAKHMRNLNLKSEDIKHFICSVCTGLQRSDFWSNQVNGTGRNFNAVFGYNNPQDKKMRNIENLYLSGLEDHQTQDMPASANLNDDEFELIEAYKFVKMNLSMARDSQSEMKIDLYQNHYDIITKSLIEKGIDLEAI